MRGADELRNVGSQVVGDIDGVETYGSTCLVRAARSDELLTLGGGEEADRTVDSNGGFVVHVRDDGVNIAPPMTVPLAFRWFSVMGISQMA